MINTNERNLALANDIKDFMIKNNIAEDTRIYFNGMAYDSVNNSEYKEFSDIKGSTYFEYADDESVSMSFEGALYHMINYGENRRLLEKFDNIFTKHKCYYELGYAWSLRAVFDW